MSLKEAEEFLLKGDFGDGINLKANFNIFSNGMIDMLFDNKISLIQDLSIAKKIVGSGAALMSASRFSESTKGDLVELIETTSRIQNLPNIDSETINQKYPLEVLNVPETKREGLLDIILNRFEENLSASGVNTKILHSEITEENLKHISESLELMFEYLPLLSKDALNAVEAILPIKSGVESAFISTTPLVIYIDQTQFKSTLKLADAIFHEALHQKLLNIRLSKRLLRPGYNDFAGIPVPIPWGNENYRMFSVGRGLAAAHVYVHLTLFHAKGSILHGEPENFKELNQSYTRANYLVQTLMMDHFRHELGIDGLKFLSWLKTSLSLISNQNEVKELINKRNALLV
ncbi:hypothetical protein [Alkalicoccobacillus murimartini]|uniref:HEXXH motif domain-containing protein n=1 Tax=Alkalicoccobacillus murimartini TaxID=171685 RepID=A0ABT9YFK3_9BACI|nr:hypothetical protein [Alkalicoccobacillus murimartini]MDQ0206633.1 hypothetical protein [Alkalicoccobacillus murimartini]